MDPVHASPQPGSSVAVAGDAGAVPSSASGSDEDARHASSALFQLADLLPVLSLTRSYRAGGEDLAELVNRRFYAGRIDSLPWAGSFLGHPSIAVDYLDKGHGMPSTTRPERNESVDAEVDRVSPSSRSTRFARPRESPHYGHHRQPPPRLRGCAERGARGQFGNPPHLHDFRARLTVPIRSPCFTIEQRGPLIADLSSSPSATGARRTGEVLS